MAPQKTVPPGLDRHPRTVGTSVPRRRKQIAVSTLARAYTDEAIRTLAIVMRTESYPAMARVTAAKVLLDRGWGRASETHHINVEGEGATLLKVVNEIVHVHETREQIEFRDQTPLLELTPEDTDGNGSKSTH